MSKAALQGITRTVAATLAPRGVTVNCVNPGPVDTGYASDEQRQSVAAQMPMRRWGAPSDIAPLVGATRKIDSRSSANGSTCENLHRALDAAPTKRQKLAHPALVVPAAGAHAAQLLDILRIRDTQIGYHAEP